MDRWRIEKARARLIRRPRPLRANTFEIIKTRLGREQRHSKESFCCLRVQGTLPEFVISIVVVRTLRNVGWFVLRFYVQPGCGMNKTGSCPPGDGSAGRLPARAPRQDRRVSVPAPTCSQTKFEGESHAREIYQSAKSIG